MKRSLKRFLLACPGFASLCRHLTRRHVRALLYHRFVDEGDADPRFLPRAVLRRQVELIARHHAAWTPDDQLAAVTGADGRDGVCPVVVTVDDGYHDFYEIAFPVFREFGVPVMFFVTTSFIDGSTWFWWDRLEYMLEQTAVSRLTTEVGDGPVELDLTSATGRRAAWHRVGDRCRFLDDTEKKATLTRLARLLAVDVPSRPAKRYRPASWDQIREMVAGGMLMGAHTINHPILSRVNEATARTEMEVSRDRLAVAIGHPVHWFCYPQGGPADFTPAIKKLVREIGFRGCYIAYQDLSLADDVYAMPRYGAAADMTDFRWMLCGAEYLVLRLRDLVGLSTGPGAGYWAESAPE